jgi:hypothetical protein
MTPLGNIDLSALFGVAARFHRELQAGGSRKILASMFFSFLTQQRLASCAASQ